MAADKGRKRRRGEPPISATIKSALATMEREVERIEASVDRPVPIPVVPMKGDEPVEEKKENEFDAGAVKKNSLRAGLLVGIIAWLGIGGWAGAGCYGCSESGNAVFGAIGFVFVGVLSAFLIGVAGASITAFTACWKEEQHLERAFELFAGVSWDNDEIAVGAIVLTVIGCLLALCVLVGAFFSLI